MASKIKKLFTSRYGDDGAIINVDYKQIEVVYAAYVSDDPTLKEEVTNGYDMHSANAQAAWGKVTKKTRQDAKIITFQTLYGAGTKKIASANRLDKKFVEEFTKQFFNKYRYLKLWHDTLEEDLKVQTQTMIVDRVKRQMFKYYTPFHNWYCILDKDSPDFIREKTGKARSISPTTLKNYPIQGGAGDILKLNLGVLAKQLIKRGWDEYLVNTVHDSVMLDAPKDKVDELKKICNDVLTSTKLVNALTGRPFDLPLRVDIEVGKSWGELEE